MFIVFVTDSLSFSGLSPGAVAGICVVVFLLVFIVFVTDCLSSSLQFQVCLQVL